MWTKFLDEEGDPYQSARLTRLDFAMLALNTISAYVGCTADIISSYQRSLAGHYNADIDQRRFAIDAAQEIERLIEGVTDGSARREENAE